MTANKMFFFWFMYMTNIFRITPIFWIGKGNTNAIRIKKHLQKATLKHASISTAPTQNGARGRQDSREMTIENNQSINLQSFVEAVSFHFYG